MNTKLSVGGRTVVVAAAVTATARENMETVRDSLGVAEGSGLESIAKLDNSTEQ